MSFVVGIIAILAFCLVFMVIVRFCFQILIAGTTLMSIALVWIVGDMVLNSFEPSLPALYVMLSGHCLYLSVLILRETFW